MCYTYDELSRVTKRTVKNLSDVVLSEEAFTYDAAGNVTAAPGCSFVYDVSNRLTSFNGSAVSYDLDGNMLSNGSLSCTYDSANRLISAGGHTYTYNAEDVRIRNLCNTEDTTYTYDTNCRLSKLLMKTTNGVVTKYVYGRGLIGEEVDNNPCLNVYHFDLRGSTVAITDMSGAITDTFTYDTYGKLTARTGTSSIIFGYNGRDGVVTDENGLIYMRARYYSPNMKRFINADILPGHISNAVTLNRFAYANGNPVSFVDPFGLSAERAGIQKKEFEYFLTLFNELLVFSKDLEYIEIDKTFGLTRYYQTFQTTLGQGMNIDKILKGQLEITQSMDFSLGKFEKTHGTDGNIGIKYSADIDEYNAVSISTTFNIVKQTYTFEYQIATQVEEKHFISTTLGIEKKTQTNTQPPPVTDKISVEEKEPSFWEKAGKVVEDVGTALGAFGKAMVTAGEEMVNFSKEHPLLGALAIGVLVLIPGPQPF